MPSPWEAEAGGSGASPTRSDPAAASPTDDGAWGRWRRRLGAASRFGGRVGAVGRQRQPDLGQGAPIWVWQP
jgi:hypothetical protein